eukprot:CAMPEP_0182459158 /NCGR_PEP_ID=MMETSP1319-20130603/4339_1 /TAXON_ID=172717 /ORGANISM="Bolidomonas pacifica, Strain RCC208" /LENGTH=218 /DNA_ID=CAMNT_0024658001 /DNA_START=192 /DNA_END=848 /DNA_ORIENTATION=+
MTALATAHVAYNSRSRSRGARHNRLFGGRQRLYASQQRQLGATVQARLRWQQFTRETEEEEERTQMSGIIGGDGSNGFVRGGSRNDRYNQESRESYPVVDAQQPPRSMSESLPKPSAAAPANSGVAVSGSDCVPVAKDTLRSLISGLEHISTCNGDCGATVCGATRRLVERVNQHTSSCSSASTCTFCLSWARIAMTHKSTCPNTNTAACSVPMCSNC